MSQEQQDPPEMMDVDTPPPEANPPQPAGDDGDTEPSAAGGDALPTTITLTASTEYACYSPATQQQCWAVTNFKAPYYEPTARAPVDIVAVIDKSGSMGGPKIALVRETLLFVIEQLKDCDRISLVVYDTEVELVFGLMKMSEENKEKAKSFVSSIRAGTSTNLCGGLVKGMQQIALTNGGEKAQVQSVLLLTDGLANHGITHKIGIIEQMKKMQTEGLGAVAGPQPPSAQNAFAPSPLKFKSKKKKQMQQAAPPPQMQMQQQQAMFLPPPMTVEEAPLDPATSGYKFDGTVYTFGFGSDHDADMLEAISTQGGGVYYYIDTNDKIPESFADCLGGLLSVMGQNLCLKLEAQGDNSFKDVHANRTINWVTPKKSCEIGMGDIQSEESRDIVLELELPALTSGPTSVEDVPIVKAQLSYFNIITSQFDTVECELKTNRTDGERGAGNVTVDIQRNRILTTSVLKKAEALADSDKLKEAQDALKEAIATLEASASKDEGMCKMLVLDLKKCLDGMTSRESFMGHGKNYMRSKLQSHAVQRSNYVDEDDDDDSMQCGYANFSKANYRKKAKGKK